MGESTARRIAGVLRESGYAALFVGGCVRDTLLGITPKDFDVATNARPEQVIARFPEAETVGAHFGVVLVRLDGVSVEVATFRSDSAYSDGRHPDRVSYEAEPRADAMRRDFTINALFQDPFSGQILDYVGGQADLREGVVRAIGDAEARFREDHLRMLRAVRFAAPFGFRIEDGTRRAMERLHGLIHKVSVERIREELLRILTEGGARRGLELMDEC
ncbi:MAG: CCA tRNA nucleotidyltransferase, partial [Acidobacteria bacterium]|nr:CCA tRNA nucleotidyltransferase [Acidobacteriota bacterium]